MAHIGAGVEYALHCLLFLIGRDAAALPPSTRDLADLQGVPAEYAAKLFTRLQKAGITASSEGVAGGVRLARDAAAISVLDVVDAVEGRKPIFDCREIRGGCAVFGGHPPDWATSGVCGIHAVMLEAEARMRAALAGCSLADLAGGLARKAPDEFDDDVADWLAARSAARRDGVRKKGKDQ